MRAEGLASLAPPGRRLEVPGRGTTFIRELKDPPGARVHRLAAGHPACAERPDLFVPALVDACGAVSR